MTHAIRRRFPATIVVLLLPVFSFGDGTLAPSNSKALAPWVPPQTTAPESFVSAEDLGELQRGLLLSIRAPTPVYAKISLDKSRLYVLDGDTIIYGARGDKQLNIRVLGIDTPEIHHYAAGKFEDQEYGQKARDYVRGVMHRARKVEYLPCGEDIFGRSLAHVFVDDQLLAIKLLKRGYAYETISHYGDNGYPELAAAILGAAETGSKPSFENPYLWRQRMWSEEKERAELDKDISVPKTLADKSQIYFQDGDTVYFSSVEIRILGIDTPEIAHPEHNKPEGQEYGPEAAEFTKQAILNAKKVEYIIGEGSTYGRAMGHVFVDGELLAIRIIKARFAYENISRFGANGFPGYSRNILEAFHSVPRPAFENPQYWRWKHWGEPQPAPISPEPDLPPTAYSPQNHL